MALLDTLDPSRTMHLCLDMQGLFAPGGVWPAPWLERVLPQVAALAAGHPTRTVFTRFMPPQGADEASGAWKRVYREWPQATRGQLDPRQLELLPALLRFVPPALVVDKTRYSAFFGTPLAHVLKARDVSTVVLTGAETDVCVLATALDCVDIGWRTVIVEDAVCSSADGTHDALMKLYRERYTNQIELATAAEVIAAWK